MQSQYRYVQAADGSLFSLHDDGARHGGDGRDVHDVHAHGMSNDDYCSKVMTPESGGDCRAW